MTLTEGPFVDCVTHDSAIISWETDQPSRGVILINETEVTDSKLSIHHEVLITGLKPDRRYVYRVRYATDDGLTPSSSFRTSPAPGSQRPFKFGFMSDSRGGVGGGERSMNGVNFKDLSAFATELYYKGADFICFGGNREGYMRANQLEWLNRDLQAAQDDANIDWVFLYLHEPAFPNGGHVRDAMYWASQAKESQEATMSLTRLLEMSLTCAIGFGR